MYKRMKERMDGLEYSSTLHVLLISVWLRCWISEGRVGVVHVYFLQVMGGISYLAVLLFRSQTITCVKYSGLVWDNLRFFYYLLSERWRYRGGRGRRFIQAHRMKRKNRI